MPAASLGNLQEVQKANASVEYPLRVDDVLPCLLRLHLRPRGS